MRPPATGCRRRRSRQQEQLLLNEGNDREVRWTVFHDGPGERREAVHEQKHRWCACQAAPRCGTWKVLSLFNSREYENEDHEEIRRVESVIGPNVRGSLARRVRRPGRRGLTQGGTDDGRATCGAYDQGRSGHSAIPEMRRQRVEAEQTPSVRRMVSRRSKSKAWAAGLDHPLADGAPVGRIGVILLVEAATGTGGRSTGRRRRC